jgi:hypothetical protein
MLLDVGVLVLALICSEDTWTQRIEQPVPVLYFVRRGRSSRCEVVPLTGCGQRLVESVQLDVLKILVALMCSGGDLVQRIGNDVWFRWLLQVASGSDATGA